jgi:hypothetical protein
MKSADHERASPLRVRALIMRQIPRDAMSVFLPIPEIATIDKTSPMKSRNPR